MAKLRKQFEQALNLIEINGQKLERAIEAHTEIRELLQQDEQLKQWGYRATANRLVWSTDRHLPRKRRGHLPPLHRVWIRKLNPRRCMTLSGA